MSLQGLHLVVPGISFTHHGIGTQHGTVIHYVKHRGLFPQVQETSLAEFTGGLACHVAAKPHSPQQAAEFEQRARQFLGRQNYSPLGENCEHLVNWVTRGVHESRQAKGAGLALGLMVAGAFFLGRRK